MKMKTYIFLGLWLLITPVLFAQELLSPEEIQIYNNQYKTIPEQQEPFTINHAVYVDGALPIFGEVSLLYRYHFSKYFSVMGGVGAIVSTESELLGAAIGINMTTHREKPGPEFYIDLLLGNYVFQVSPEKEESHWMYFPLPKLTMGVEFISREGLLLRLGLGAYPLVINDNGSTTFIPVPFLNTSFGYAW